MIKENKQTEKLLTHLNRLIDYWAEVDDEIQKDNIEGAVFSFLVMIDGGTGEFPYGIDLIDRQTKEKISNGYLHEILKKYKS